MYYICGLIYRNGNISIECFLCEPISEKWEAYSRFEKSRKYTDGLGAGLFNTSKGKWEGIILNYKNNSDLLAMFNNSNFGPKHSAYPIANVDV